jgi:hypothetical protein
VPDDSEEQEGELSTQQKVPWDNLTEAERDAILAPLVKRLEDAEATIALWIEVSDASFKPASS